MIHVAKILLQDVAGRYLLLNRSDHPVFPDDPDLPGGLVEAGEDPPAGVIRELREETSVVIDIMRVTKIYESQEYNLGHVYYLFTASCTATPAAILSWEHRRYRWLPRDEFHREIKLAQDSYMRMVADYLKQNQN